MGTGVAGVAHAALQLYIDYYSYSLCAFVGARALTRPNPQFFELSHPEAKRLSLHPRRSPAGSPSHYAAPSPTPFQPGTSVAPSAAPSHWTMKDPSVPPELVKKPKKGKDGKTKEAKTGKGKDGKKKGKKKPEVAPSESAEPEPKPKARKAKRSRSPKRKKNS